MAFRTYLRNGTYWAKLVGLLVVAALLFITILHLGERAAYPPSTDARTAIGFTALDANGAPMPGVAAQQAVVGEVAAAGYYAPTVPDSAAVRFAIPFTVSDPAAPTAFYLATRSDVRNVQLNGVALAPSEQLEQQQGDVSSEPAYFGFPPGALSAGDNLITVEKPTFGGVHSLSSFAIGPADELASAYRWRSLLLVDSPLIGIAILLFSAVLCLIANWPAADRERMRALVMLLLVSALTTAALTYSPQGQMPITWTIGLYVVANALIALSMLNYAGQDSGLIAVRNRWLVGLAILAVLLVPPALWWAAATPELTGQRYGTIVKASFWLVIGVGTLGIAMLAHAIVAQQGRLWAERLAFIICFAFLMVDRVGTIFPLTSPFDASLPVTLPWSSVVGALLGGAVILSLARQASEARRTVVEANAILAARLAEQDGELARNYAAQRELMERQAVLEERQRIVRDMHDGIGGQLLALLMQVRGQNAVPERLADGLQASIADLRLIVDSMDTAEGGLADALHAFEHRARTLVEAAGMSFAMEHGLGEIDARFGPRETLSILRIVQEAVANAVRHSGGTKVTVASYGDESAISITVSDDGRGMTGDEERGRGLVNIETRAQALGGTAIIAGASGGTIVTLTVPVAGRAIAAA